MAPHNIADGGLDEYPTNSPCPERQETQFSSSDSSSIEDGDAIDPIAIIGFSLKFPQEAVSSDSFWKMMMERRCTATEFPEDRLSKSSRYNPDANRKDTYPIRGGHFLQDDIAAFDAPFFSISATEAAGLDPQQRGLLETTYRALENAGLPLPKIFGSKTSVYTGCFTSDWQQLCYKDSEKGQSYFALGISPCMNANRINWFFNFTGGSANIDSACSSGLVALHLACKDLINGEANMAIAAGSNLIFSPDFMHVLANMKMLSPDHHCYSFDERANGYARGEGFGVLILKRLSDAIKDGDVIRAVIRGTGSNQDGFTPGIMQPSKDGQERLIKETYQKAGLRMENTRYLEAHGTGTPVGDPLEANAFGSAFRAVRTAKDPLYVGALKGNIGHLEGASGVAGVIKAILALEKGIIPPNANFERLNPRIDAEYLRIKFPTHAIPWPDLHSGSQLRRASVNSFGFGGTNAHVILDDAFHYLLHRGLKGRHNTVQTASLSLGFDASSVNSLDSHDPTAQDTRLNRPKLLVFSAYDSAALKRSTAQYTKLFTDPMALDQNGQSFLADLAYTLAAKRTRLRWKNFVVSDSFHDLKNIEDKFSSPVQSLEKVNLGFVFTGQGAQWARMGCDLSAFPVFQRSLKDAELYLRKIGCSWMLCEELSFTAEKSNINKPEYSQPICTAVQIAMVDLLQSFNICPTTVVGHSSGEIAAAYCAGAISSRDALMIAYYRGVYAAKLVAIGNQKGAMMSVGLSEDLCQSHIDKLVHRDGYKGIRIACINSNKNVTLSGDGKQINDLKQLFDDQGIFCRKLAVDVAYHSHHMEAVALDYGKAIQGLSQSYHAIKKSAMFSSVTGTKIAVDQLRQPDYWVKNMISPVNFYDAMKRVCDQSTRKSRKKLDCSHRDYICLDMLVEIGPHSALQGPIQEILSATSAQNIRYTSILIREAFPGVHNTLKAVGLIHCLGYPVDLKTVNSSDDDREPNILTNLPEYPFDHSRSYWYETRISKQNRLHPQGKLDLLGKPAMDWNPLEAKWRNFIKLSDMPWVADHVVSGSLIYPAAGMLAMAIEAANQMANHNQRIEGFKLKNVIFKKTLVIPQDDEGVETNFYLREASNATDHKGSWYEFRLYSFSSDKWLEHCYGLIKVEYIPETASNYHEKDMQEELQRHRHLHDKTALSCVYPTDHQKLYADLNDGGFGFGPAFQRLRQVRCSSQGEANAKIELYKWPESQFPQPHVVHPTSLDGMLHLVLAVLARGSPGSVSTAVPSSIDTLWSASTGLDASQDTQVDATAVATKVDNRGSTFDINVLSDSHERILMRTEGLRMTIIAESLNIQTIPREKRPAYWIDFQPDGDLMEMPELKEYCSSVQYDTPEPKLFYRNLLFLLYVFLTRALDSLGDFEPTQAHLKKYVSWARLQLEHYRNGTLPHSHPEWDALKDNDEYVEAVCTSVQSATDQGRVFVTTGRNLPSMLRGEIDPLEFLFKSDLLRDLYRDINSNRPCFPQFDRYLKTLVHKNPNMKVIEVGAGTGGTSAKILQALSVDKDDSKGKSRYLSYTYTDISSSFFETAQKDFKDYPKMIFRPLNIEKDPIEQGYEEHSYDFVVAANVLHATADINTTMRNVRKLLKPGGKLMMYEISRPDTLRTGFVAGLLPGWWLSTDSFRRWAPSLSSASWHKVLLDQGFSGIDLELPEYESLECQETSIFISTAAPKASKVEMQQVTFIIDAGSEMQYRASQDLKTKYMGGESIECDILTMDEVVDATRPKWNRVVFLLEIERPMLYGMSSAAYSTVQGILTSANDVLWVTAGGGTALKDPAYGIVDGLSRAIRSENTDTQLTTLALDIKGSGLSESQLLKICRLHSVNRDISNREFEYVQIKNLYMIPRAVQSSHLTQEIHRRSLPQQSSTLSVSESPPMKLAIGSLGLLESLHFIEDKERDLPLAPNEVEIEVKAVGLNYNDCQMALGQKPGANFGNECAGFVTRAGESCKALSTGDRVMLASSGCFKTLARGNLNSVYKIPERMSIQEAASIPVDFTTAWHVIHEIASIRKNESLLVHAAAGGIGQAALQIAQHQGIEIYATIGSSEEKRILEVEYGISEDHIFHNSDINLSRKVMHATSGRRVDVVIDSSTGDDLVTSLECTAPYGRLIKIGQMDLHSTANLATYSFKRSISFTCFDALSWFHEQPERAGEALRTVLDLFEAKCLHTVHPFHVRTVEDIREAFLSMQDNQPAGKLVIDITPDARVPTLLDTYSSYSLDSNGTYLIAGGLGGIGRIVARWMVGHGARNFILLSRSGPKHETAIALLEEFKAKGVKVEAPACDIIDAGSLRAVVDRCAVSLPPIRGCVQASMVLRNSAFQNMSYEDWNLSTQCKTVGSFNLHSLLPPNLDFFIMLSSVSGIVGIHGQANYGAGNAYMDSLARHRVSHGQKAVALDLGGMIEDGLLTEDLGLMNRVMSYGTFSPVTRDQTFALLDYYCDPTLPLLTPVESQMVIGLGTGPSVKRQTMFAHTIQDESSTAAEHSGKEGVAAAAVDFRKLFVESTSLMEAGDVASRALIQKLSGTLSTLTLTVQQADDCDCDGNVDVIGVVDVDMGKPLSAYGVDSLLAVEVRRWIGTEFSADVPVFEIQGAATFSSVGLLIAGRSTLRHGEWS